MGDSADFEVKLKDSVSGPAKRASSAANKLRDDLMRLNRQMKSGAISQRAAANSAMKLRSQLRSANMAIAATGRHAAASTGGVSRLQGAFGSLKGAAGGLATVAKVALAGIAIAAVAAAVAVAKITAAFVSATIQAASFGQKAALAFGLLLKSGSKGSAELTKIMAVAADLGLPIQETTKQFQKLLAMQFKPAAATDIIKMTSDLRALGAGADEVKRSILAMTQIKAKGRVQSEELLQLAEAGVSLELIYKDLQKQTGKTKDEIRKMLEAGKISSQMGLDAIGNAIKAKTNTKNFGDAGRAFADKTLEGMAGRLKAKVQLQFMALGKAILPGLMDIGKNVGILFDRLSGSKSVQDMAKGIKGLFNTVIGAVNKAMPGIEGFIKSFAKAFGPALGIASKDLKNIDWAKFNAGLTAAGSSLGFLAGSLAIVFKAGLNVAKGFMVFLGAVQYVATGVIGYAGMIRDVVLGHFYALSNSMTALGQATVTGFTSGFTSQISTAVQAAKSLATQVKGAVTSTLDMHSPSRVFAQLGQYTAQGFQQGMQVQQPRVEAATASMFRQTASAPAAAQAVASEAGSTGGSGGGNTFGDIHIHAPTGDGVDIRDALAGLIAIQTGAPA